MLGVSVCVCVCEIGGWGALWDRPAVCTFHIFNLARRFFFCCVYVYVCVCVQCVNTDEAK